MPEKQSRLHSPPPIPLPRLLHPRCNLLPHLHPPKRILPTRAQGSRKRTAGNLRTPWHDRIRLVLNLRPRAIALDGWRQRLRPGCGL